jgi:hypothetical protein
MSRITQTIRMPATGPTADEIVDGALSTAQDAMDVLGPDATPLLRALALVGLGHPCWFAIQKNRNFFPVAAGGGVAHEGRYRPTLDAAKLRNLAHGNTVIFVIALPNGTSFPCVYDRQFQRCGPFVQHVDAGVRS